MSSVNKHAQAAILMISQSRPIIIDTEQEYKQSKHINTITTISKLPAFEPDDKITKILYSKFLVKGVNPINNGLMLSKVKRGFDKKETIPAKQSLHLTKERIVTEQLNNHYKLKPQSDREKQSGIFDFAMNHYETLDKKGKRPQTAFQRSQSLNHLNRPQSAAHTSSQKKLIRPTSVERSSIYKRNRSQTAITRTSSAKNNLINRFQINDSSENIRPIMTISDEVSNLKNINYIQKNKRQASIKKQSPYITDVEIPTNTASERKSKQKQIKQYKLKERFEHRETITSSQKQKIKQKHVNYLNYLKKNHPNQYSECINYLCTLDNDGRKLDKSLFDLGFDEQSFQPSKKEIEEHQIRHFYQNFYNICVDVQYGIKKAQRKKKTNEKSSNILNLYQCEQILTLYKEISLFRQEGDDYSYKTQRLRQIIKNLEFFRNLKPEIMRNLLQMEYSIAKIQDSIQVVHENEAIENIYIILNGSAAKKNRQQDQQFIDFHKNRVPEFFTTLFDGEVFGLPSKPQEKTLSYSVKTLQSCYMMIFPYKQYKKALSSNQNIQDRVQLLKLIFSNNKGVNKFGKQDFETIAFQMQSISFSALELIYRQQEPCQKLIIVASGKVSICFESILTRKKLNNSPLPKKYNQIVPQYKIKDFRKKNLKNYELIHQNAEQITYYVYEIVQQKTRGDILNWQGFYRKLVPQTNNGQEIQYFLSYSLVKTCFIQISNQDNTKIYQLSAEKTEIFPHHIKDSIVNKTEELQSRQAFKRNSRQMGKWEQYKQNLVSNILKEKSKR